MKMHHKVIFLSFLLLLAFAGCEKEKDKKVVYRISKNATGFLVHYRNAEGILSQSAVDVGSAEDVWSHEFISEEGEIVFVSAIYKNIQDEIRVEILIDGKVYKQGASKNDTINYVTVSGTIPYE